MRCGASVAEEQNHGLLQVRSEVRPRADPVGGLKSSGDRGRGRLRKTRKRAPFTHMSGKVVSTHAGSVAGSLGSFRLGGALWRKSVSVLTPSAELISCAKALAVKCFDVYCWQQTFGQQ